MGRRPIREFTAPFVITAACHRTPPPAAIAPPPPVAPDAAVAPDATAAPMIVRGDGTSCFRVPTGEPIDCPPGGATIALPDQTLLRRGDVEVEIDEDSMQCARQVYGNPPYWVTLDRCPRALLPHLTNGAVPTQIDEDGTCWFGFTEVLCGTTSDHLAGPTVKARLILVDASKDGSEIAFNRGRNDGVAVGDHGVIEGLPGSDFIVDRCQDRACYAPVALDKQTVEQSSQEVEVEYLPPDP